MDALIEQIPKTLAHAIVIEEGVPIDSVTNFQELIDDVKAKLLCLKVLNQENLLFYKKAKVTTFRHFLAILKIFSKLHVYKTCNFNQSFVYRISRATIFRKTFQFSTHSVSVKFREFFKIVNAFLNRSLAFNSCL